MSAPLALVTGASSGIGAATAEALAAAGWSLLLQGRDAERSAALLARVERSLAPGCSASLVRADLSDDAGSERLVAAVDGRPLAALVHAAGMVTLGSVADTPVDVLDAHHALNVRAPYLLTRALLGPLRAARGHVVFVNSGAGQRANPSWSSYAMSKFALRAFADALRAEEGELRVTSVYPGRTATPMQASVRAAEGAEYDPGAFVQPGAVAEQIVALLQLPRPSLVSDLSIRPG